MLNFNDDSLMLYEIAHVLKDKFGFLWELIEIANGWLFGFRYRKKFGNMNGLLAPMSIAFVKL